MTAPARAGAGFLTAGKATLLALIDGLTAMYAFWHYFPYSIMLRSTSNSAVGWVMPNDSSTAGHRS